MKPIPLSAVYAAPAPVLTIGSRLFFHDGMQIRPAVVVEVQKPEYSRAGELLRAELVIIGIFGYAYITDSLRVESFSHNPTKYGEWNFI